LIAEIINRQGEIAHITKSYVMLFTALASSLHIYYWNRRIGGCL